MLQGGKRKNVASISRVLVKCMKRSQGEREGEGLELSSTALFLQILKGLLGLPPEDIYSLDDQEGQSREALDFILSFFHATPPKLEFWIAAFDILSLLLQSVHLHSLIMD